MTLTLAVRRNCAVLGTEGRCCNQQQLQRGGALVGDWSCHSDAVCFCWHVLNHDPRTFDTWRVSRCVWLNKEIYKPKIDIPKLWTRPVWSDGRVGLRRWSKVPVYSWAGVRIPLRSATFWFKLFWKSLRGFCWLVRFFCSIAVLFLFYKKIKRGK